MAEEPGKEIADSLRDKHGVNPDVVGCGSGSQVAEGVDHQHHGVVQTNSVDVENGLDHI